MTWLLLILGSYLLGSAPFGLLIARLHGIDLRKVGSGNIGATNVSRALGKQWAYVCFALDVCKGLAPMLLAGRLDPVSKPPTPLQLFCWLAVGAAAILGHIFPVYVRFKGGKGVATSLGVVLGLWPWLTLCGLVAFAVWGAAVLVSRMVSLASILAAGLFPILLAAAIALLPDWTFAALWPLFLIAVPIPVLVIVRHRDNIRRILAGTEHKIGQKKTTTL
jgi:glycerol-3-phosphate acyltransferase PlsY